MGKVTGFPWKGRAYLRSKYPGSFPLSESQIDVLEGMAIATGPTNAYKLAKSIGRAYSFVFNSLKELKRRGIVTFEGEQETEKGKTAKLYDLALEGVLIVLQREMKNDDRMNRGFVKKIMAKYRSLLPLVFGKWKYFEEIGFGQIFLIRLKIIVDTHKNNPFRRGTGFYPWLKTKEQITRFFYIFDYLRLENHFITDFEAKAWLTALKQDKEIRNYTIEEFKYEQRRLKNIQKYVERILQFMEPTSKKVKSL